SQQLRPDADVKLFVTASAERRADRRYQELRDKGHTDFQPELKTTLTSKFYNDVASPIRSWVFSDDPIATSKSAQDVLDCYPNAASELITVSPPELGLKHVGHDGAFRKGRTAIWEQVWQFLNS
ncbi:MAG: (d)CMP kinase, partial [Pseudomonadota bacterium]